TSVALTSTPANGGSYKTPVTFTATVTAPQVLVVPTGNNASVTFVDTSNGNLVLGTGTHTGSTTWSISNALGFSLFGGSHVIQATYHDNNGNYADGVKTLTFVVSNAP